MSDLTISHLARKANVNVETIRYYERRGLMQQPPRSENGYRHYDEHDAAQLRFIRDTQTLGFTLREIKQLLALRCNGPDCRHDIQQLIENKLTHVHREIQQLKAIETRLQYYTANGNRDICPLLDELWPHQSGNDTTTNNA
jgi:MerR family mercuric resistance operon transcriptional regulator